MIFVVQKAMIPPTLLQMVPTLFAGGHFFLNDFPLIFTSGFCYPEPIRQQQRLGVEQLLKKIISGGQTGADRAALDVAIKLQIPHGGCVPKDCIAEDGPLRYKTDVDLELIIKLRGCNFQGNVNFFCQATTI